MTLYENYSLFDLNTFKIDVKAELFSSFKSLEELLELLTNPLLLNKDLLVLGGGSNVLFTKDFNGLILRNEIKGIIKIKEDDENIYIKSGAGESWNDFVLFCINNNFSPAFGHLPASSSGFMALAAISESLSFSDISFKWLSSLRVSLYGAVPYSIISSL